MADVVASGAHEGRHFRAMRTAGTQHLVERTYREGAPFQWARETVRNAIEAGATRIEFTLDWQAVENYGIYRRAIIDNGKGMDPKQIVQFFNTYGGGGKPIGGEHENFGVGAKTSLLPWNHFGIVVVSRSAGFTSMIWLQRDAESGEYGLKLFEAEDDYGNTSWVPVVEPYDGTEEDGTDWRAILPDDLGESGTAIVLLGNSQNSDTILGDPNRQAEESTHGLAQYLNRRLWRLPGDFEISVDSLPVKDRKSWPKSRVEYTTKQGSGRTRRVRGAEALIRDGGNALGELRAEGTVDCKDGTQVSWFLWEGDRPDRSNHAFTDGFIAAEYGDELYNYTTHAAHYRQFGISEENVRKRVWLIIRPPLHDSSDPSSFGVYPNSSRNQLLIQGGARAGDPLPIAEWAAEFADEMPEEIIKAILESRAGMQGSIDDNEWRERLAERFGSRWRIPKLRVSVNGQEPMSSQSSGTNPKRRPIKVATRRSSTGGGNGATAGVVNTGTQGGAERGERRMVSGGLPTYRWVPANQVSQGMIAAWMPKDPQCPEGVVLLNAGHPVILDQVEYWQNQYAPHQADEVLAEVHRVYGEVAVAKVAHSEHLRSLMPDSDVVDEKLRSEEALTMALLGLVAEESMIATRIGGKMGKRKRPVGVVEANKSELERTSV